MTRIALLLAFALLGNVAAHAFPDKPIRLLVGFPGGSLPDTIARLIGPGIAANLGQPVIVENIAGAAGNIAADRVAKAAPDGHVLGVLGQTQLAVNPSLYRLPFDPIADFAPISRLTLSANVLVVPKSSPASKLNELIGQAKANPGALTFASAGPGSGTHLAGELLASAAGIDLRNIPYKGVVAAIPDLLDGRVTMMFSPVQTVLPLVRDGRLRPLAVTSAKRVAILPDVPSVAELGYPDYEATLWYGLVAPAAMPAGIVRILHGEAVRALASTEVRDRLARIGVEEAISTPDEFAALIRREIPKWSSVIKKARIVAQ